RARRAGVRAGFTLSQARARLPKLIARARDEECERAAAEALLDVAESFSPRVEHGGGGAVYLDAEGLDRHYPGDEPELELGRELGRAMEARASLPVRVGVASSKLAACLAARRSSGPEVIPPGGAPAFLAPMPLDRVTPQASTLATLEQWGIHSLGELASLPEAEVVSRLGEAGRELQAIARGEDPRPLVPRTPPPTFREGMELEWPLVSLEPFLFLARAALERLTVRMASQALACRRLELDLGLEPDGHHGRAIELPAPTRDVKTLLELMRLDLEAHPPGAPVVSYRFTAHPDRPRHAQLSLFGPEALSPERLATSLARLFALLGPGRVGSPRPVDGHRPEAYHLEPYAPPPPPERRPPTPPGRGLLTLRTLRPPLPVEVMTKSPPAGRSPRKPRNGQPPSSRPAKKNGAATPPDDAPPIDDHPGDDPLGDGHRPCPDRPVAVETPTADETTKKPKIRGAVKVASGPWTLEESWWQTAPQKRDYWDVELTTGGLYRLFREQATGDWFVDGIYD
ncbi:MAG: hypothetical protein MI919_27055, partial [Holophagales bacterium]|nr:hypothetical protein [Holophagales bacterium]